jgi:protein-disulfide isomerase
MAKKVRKRRTTRKVARKTNWVVIGGVVGIGVIGLFALLFVALQGGDAASSNANSNNFLTNFCNSNEANCIEQGASDAPVTFIEVSDYGCGHCRNFNLDKANALKEQYVATNQVRWVVMPYTLRDQSGQLPTLPSAVSAMCANEQDRFFDYHHALFELQGSPLFNTEAGFMDTAASLEMDTEAFASCLQNNDYTDVLLRNISAAKNAGVRSTPTFFINGRKVEGNLPNISDFQQVIDAALGS